MARTECDISDVRRARVVDAWNALQLQWGVVSEQYLWCVLNGSPPGIDELLQENFAKDSVCFFAEHGGKDDGNPIVAGLDIDGLLVSIMDCTHNSTLGYTLWRRLGCIFGRLLLQMLEFVESLLKGRGHGIPLEQRYTPDKVLLLRCAVSAPYSYCTWRAIGHTLSLWQILQIYKHREVIARFRLDNVRPVLALQHRLRAILNQFVVTFDVE